MKKNHLIQLSAQLDSVMEFRYPDDEEGSGLGTTAATVAGGGTLAAGGLYGAGARAQGVKLGNIGNKLRYDRGMGQIGNTIKTGANAGIDALKGLAGKLRGRMRFQAPARNLVELNAILDDCITVELDVRRNEKGQSVEGNIGRGAIGGMIVGGPMGALASGIAGAQYKGHGVIYKKRDAVGHAAQASLGGVLGGGAAAALTRGRSAGAIQAGVAAGSLGGYYAGTQNTLRKRIGEQRKAGVMLNAILDDTLMEFRSPFDPDMPGGQKRVWGGVFAANPGQKMAAYKEVAGDNLKSQGKGAAIGAGVGAGAGALAAGGLLLANRHRLPRKIVASVGKKGAGKLAGQEAARTKSVVDKGNLLRGTAKIAAIGAGVGGYGGMMTGAYAGPNVLDTKYDRYFQ